MTLATVTVEAIGLGIQAWAGQAEPDPNRRMRPRRTEGPRPKPDDGFLTSTWDAGRRSCSWLEFMHANGERPGEDRRLWTLMPDPKATLYRIDSLGAYKDL